MSGFFRLVVCFVLASALVLVAVGLSSDGTRDAAAQAEQEAGEPPAPPPELARMFEPYPADDGALSYEDLNADEKAAADRAAEWAEADHGHDVHQRWRQASREGARLSTLRFDEYLSGLSGLEGLGVE